MRLGTSGKLERVGKLAQHLGLRGALGMAPVERFLGVAAGLLDQLAAVAALRPLDQHLALRPARTAPRRAARGRQSRSTRMRLGGGMSS
jgi:hypothetical protein